MTTSHEPTPSLRAAVFSALSTVDIVESAVAGSRGSSDVYAVWAAPSLEASSRSDSTRRDVRRVLSSEDWSSSSRSDGRSRKVAKTTRMSNNVVAAAASRTAEVRLTVGSAMTSAMSLQTASSLSIIGHHRARLSHRSQGHPMCRWSFRDACAAGDSPDSRRSDDTSGRQDPPWSWSRPSDEQGIRSGAACSHRGTHRKVRPCRDTRGTWRPSPAPRFRVFGRSPRNVAE